MLSLEFTARKRKPNRLLTTEAAKREAEKLVRWYRHIGKWTPVDTGRVHKDINGRKEWDIPAKHKRQK